MPIPNQFRDSVPAVLAILLVAIAAVDAARVSNPASFDGPIPDVPGSGPVDRRSVAANRPQPTTEHIVVEPAEEVRGWRPGPLHPAPAVVRFRPRAGSTGVAAGANLSVRFTMPMAHDATEAAFSATLSGKELSGRSWWAEGDTVLVFDPKALLPRGAHVTLEVGGGARSAYGVPLGDSVTVSFAVVAAASPQPSPQRVTSSAWRWPLSGPITQRFGQSLTKYGIHQGIDIDGTTGNPVRAARSGTVTVAGHYDSCGGLEVHIDHGDGLVSWYRHLAQIDVAVGQEIVGGTLIGAVGNTGCSLGSHLHFAIRRGSTFVDPLAYLPPR